MATPIGGVIWLSNKKDGIENPNYGIRKVELRFFIWKKPDVWLKSENRTIKRKLNQQK